MTLKILCAGMNRTGTSSLHCALQQLGYRSIHCAPHLIDFWNPPDSWSMLGHYEAVSDLPFWFFWEEIYREHGCKVVLTERNPADWFDSMLRHSLAQPHHDTPSYMVLYGAGYPHRDRWTARFQAHNARVRRQVAPADLLRMNICAGDGWEKLCEFLEHPIPDEPFPHV